MKKLLMLALIATLFSGCAKKIYVKPKLFAIDAKTKKLPTRKINFEVIEADDNVTAIVKSVLIPLRDARWITAKLNRCVKNNKKLEVANEAWNEQIKGLDDEN